MKKLLALALAMGMQPLAAQQDPRASLLVDRGCSDCHTIAALKVTKSRADVGPDRPSLRPAERDSLVTLFRDLYLEQLARLDSAQRRLRVVEAQRQKGDGP